MGRLIPAWSTTAGVKIPEEVIEHPVLERVE